MVAPSPRSVLGDAGMLRSSPGVARCSLLTFLGGHPLAWWRLTFLPRVPVRPAEEATVSCSAGADGLPGGASRWASSTGNMCLQERETPLDKPVASSAGRTGTRGKSVSLHRASRWPRGGMRAKSWAGTRRQQPPAPTPAISCGRWAACVVYTFRRNRPVSTERP